MKHIDYITFNDLYGGIYKSQVIEVVDYLNSNFDVNVRLIAFIPIKLWNKQRREFKAAYPKAIVLPILGPLKFWKINRLWFAFLKPSAHGICRGPLSFVVSRNAYQQLTYDGRAAVQAEVEEYNVTGSDKLDKIFIAAEKSAVLKAESFLSVSKELVAYWEEKVDIRIDPNKLVIIPCTVDYLKIEPNNIVADKDIINIVYSGGTAPWQSFDLVVKLLRELLMSQPNTYVKFMTKETKAISELITDFPTRCERIWCKPTEVFQELLKCDYGLLIREQKVTNKVASPVKFAEYLNAGLHVLISENIGDFSKFVKDKNCGIIVHDKIPKLVKPTLEDKLANNLRCAKHFAKTSPEVHLAYQKLIRF